MDLKEHIKTIPDWPKKGIMFRDITSLLQNPLAFEYAVDMLSDFGKKVGATVVAGPEARGFIFGAPVAAKLGVGFIPVRKPGKLPRATISEEYDLEYGSNTLCVHEDAFSPFDRVLIIDDLLATGGTALASAHLVEKSGASVAGLGFVIDLIDLKGRELLKDYNVCTLCQYEGE